MREIKFRMWDKSLNKMITGENVHELLDKDGLGYPYCRDEWYPVYKVLIPFDYFEELQETTINRYQNSGNRFELMQFTGLYDKNKVPIYEEDIVETQYGKKYIVQFKTERAGFYPFACGDGCGCCEEETWSANCSEVIGNIYENSDLLGE